MSEPFMGEYFSLRSRVLLYDYVMGNKGFLKHDDKLQRNAERFQNLSEDEKLNIQSHYTKIQTYMGRAFWKKMTEGIHKILWELPPFLMAWIFFSIWISILLLRGRRGASQAVWILPIITLFYGIDNRFYGVDVPPQYDHALFPSESTVVMEYINEPLSVNWSDQQKQLKQGWENYLVKNWSMDEQNEAYKLETAEYNFTLARLNLLQANALEVSSYNEKSSTWLLSAYLLWNLFFAWKLGKQSK